MAPFNDRPLTRKLKTVAETGGQERQSRYTLPPGSLLKYQISLTPFDHFEVARDPGLLLSLKKSLRRESPYRNRQANTAFRYELMTFDYISLHLVKWIIAVIPGVTGSRDLLQNRRQALYWQVRSEVALSLLNCTVSTIGYSSERNLSTLF